MSQDNPNSFSFHSPSPKQFNSFEDTRKTGEPNMVKDLQYCLCKIQSMLSAQNTPFSLMADLFDLQGCIGSLLKDIEKLKPEKSLASKRAEQCSEAGAALLQSTAESPRVKGLDQIAGLYEIKKTLKCFVLLPKSQPQLFAKCGTSNSVLLYGPPGTGKTRLVHALAYEANVPLHSVMVSDILNPLVGQSEKNVKDLFQHVMSRDEFTMLFIDELDGLCRKRNDSEQEHSRRIKTELMCQMSKLENNPNVFLICATNCPWDLDTAFLRRFQKRLYVPLPDADDRFELFKLFSQNALSDMDMSSWRVLISRTEGFSGSDIANLVQHALSKPILELVNTTIWKLRPDNCYEPLLGIDDCWQDVKCCELDRLPPGSARARKAGLGDFLASLDSVGGTVSKVDVERHEEFSGK